ncbi:hypothetical protein QQ045_024459 [Rhodiola kirilowii]
MDQFCCSANARKDSGDYWKGVMKDEPIPAALEALILPNPAQKSSSESLVKKPNCNHDDVPTSNTSSSKDDEEAKNSLGEKPVAESFEPRPNATTYGD